MSASKFIKRLSGGTLNLKKLAELSGIPERTLKDWHKNEARQTALALVTVGAKVTGPDLKKEDPIMELSTDEFKTIEQLLDPRSPNPARCEVLDRLIGRGYACLYRGRYACTGRGAAAMALAGYRGTLAKVAKRAIYPPLAQRFRGNPYADLAAGGE